jgi:hypothetical protein
VDGVLYVKELYRDFNRSRAKIHGKRKSLQVSGGMVA